MPIYEVRLPGGPTRLIEAKTTAGARNFASQIVFAEPVSTSRAIELTIAGVKLEQATETPTSAVEPEAAAQPDPTPDPTPEEIAAKQRDAHADLIDFDA